MVHAPRSVSDETELIKHYDENLDYISLIKDNTIVKKIINALPIRIDKTTKLLDLGCGTGEFSFYMEKNHGIVSFGVDYSPKRIEYARVLNAGNNCKFICRDIFKFIEKCPIQFNMITLFDVLEHVKDPTDLVFKCMKKIKRSGIVVASVPIRHPYFMHKHVFMGIDDVRFKLKPTMAMDIHTRHVLCIWKHLY